MRFDLSKQAPRFRRAIFWSKIGLLVLVGVGAAAIAAIVFRYSVLGTWNVSHAILVAGLAWVDSMFATIAFTIARQPADWLDVGSEEILFGFGGTSVSRQRWADDGLVVTVFETQGARDRISGGKPAYAASVDRHPFRAILSPEAFRALTLACEDHGLVVQSRPSSRIGWTRLDISHTN